MRDATRKHSRPDRESIQFSLLTTILHRWLRLPICQKVRDAAKVSAMVRDAAKVSAMAKPLLENAPDA